MDSSVEIQIKQLGDARKLVLSDASHYPQIIQGILPIAAPGARVELRRWVADFLAETFASPSIPSQQKESLSLLMLETLKVMIESPQEDPAVVRSVVQTAASVYPLVVRWMYVCHFSPSDVCLQLEAYIGICAAHMPRCPDVPDLMRWGGRIHVSVESNVHA